MEKFDLEKAKQGRQIVHKDGTKAKDFHIFTVAGWAGKIFVIYIQWETDDFNMYSSDNGFDDIGLAPERVVEVLAVKEDGCYCGSESYDDALKYGGVIAVFEITYNPDGSDPTIERVEE